MKTKKIITASLGLLMAATCVMGLTACGGQSNSSGAPSSSAGANSAVDVAADLEKARTTVLAALKDKAWAQVMLASDVDAPTVKYGLMVMPYSYSNKAKRVQSTIEISGGKFTIEAVSAADGKTWKIDQDGKITEVNK